MRKTFVKKHGIFVTDVKSFKHYSFAGKVRNYLASEFGVEMTPIMSSVYACKGTAISSMSNGKTRFSSDWTKSNKGKDRIILEAAFCIGREMRHKWGCPMEMHHLKPASKRGSYNIKNLCMAPTGLNALIGEKHFSHKAMQEFLDVCTETEIGKSMNIPMWYKCTKTLEEFIALYATHTLLTSLSVAELREEYNRRFTSQLVTA